MKTLLNSALNHTIYEMFNFLLNNITYKEKIHLISSIIITRKELYMKLYCLRIKSQLCYSSVFCFYKLIDVQIHINLVI